MNTKQVLAALAALAQETRLRIFRLLVQVGPTGLAAGAIGEEISVAPATLSFHLKELERASLLTSRRESRQIYYATDFEGMGDLLAFLTEDCCQGYSAVRSQALLPSSSRKRSVSAQRSKQLKDYTFTLGLRISLGPSSFILPCSARSLRSKRTTTPNGC